MKKLLASLMIMFITISISICFAEVNYKATIINKQGSNYFIASGDEEILGGNLKYGTQIVIYEESEAEDGQYIFKFTASIEKEEGNEKIDGRIERGNFRLDIKTFNPKSLRGEEIGIKIMSPNGIKYYPNPSLGYEPKGDISQGTVVTTKRLDNYSDGNWYYIKDLEGYIHLANRNAGFTATETVFTPAETNLYDSMDETNAKVLLKIQPTVYFDDYVRFDKSWYYVSVYGYDGYFKYNDIARKSNGETSVVWYENTNLYSDASFNSIKLYNDIPVSTVLTWEYDTCVDEYGWVKVNYKKLTGWVFTLNPNLIYDDSDYAADVRQRYFDALTYGEGKGIVVEEVISQAEENKEEIVENTSVPISEEVEKNKENYIIEKEKNDSEVVNNDNNTNVQQIEEKPKDVEKPTTNNNDSIFDDTRIIIICCAVVIIILIIIIIRLAMINAGFKRRL